MGEEAWGSSTNSADSWLACRARKPSPSACWRRCWLTDIVGSTELAADVGDRAWRDLLDRHHVIVRTLLGRFHGVDVDTAGDGFLARFEGPARAVRCAVAIREAVRPLGIEVRAGLHAGEVEVLGDKVAGIAVHTGARVAARAGPSEVLVSLRR